MPQKKLNIIAVSVSLVFLTVLLIVFADFGKMAVNTFVSILLLALLFVSPLTISYFTLAKWIPSIDALSIQNIKEDERKASRLRDIQNDRERFPKPVRFLIWATFGIALSLLWTWIAPRLLVFPTYLGDIVRSAGWNDLASTDNLWQYEWMIIFLVEYVLILTVQNFNYKDEF